MSRVTCHVSCVKCHMSHVTCHMSCVTCHMSLFSSSFFTSFFFGKSGEAYRWRVCYQRGLPRLVFTRSFYIKKKILIMAIYRLNTTKCVLKWPKKHQKLSKFNKITLSTLSNPNHPLGLIHFFKINNIHIENFFLSKFGLKVI